MIVGVEPPEQGGGRLVEEVGEELLNASLSGIGAGDELPVIAELAVYKEGETPVRKRIEIG